MEGNPVEMIQIGNDLRREYLIPMLTHTTLAHGPAIVIERIQGVQSRALPTTTTKLAKEKFPG
jgi:hypothetical protein